MTKVRMIGDAKMSELQNLVALFAIEHGDALPHMEVRTNEDGDPFRVDGWQTPKIVLDNDTAAMKKYLAAAVKPKGTHDWHRGRTPAVCCSVADYLKQPHPFVGPCVDPRPRKGQHKGRTISVCAREDCPQHMKHVEDFHAPARAMTPNDLFPSPPPKRTRRKK